MAGQDQNPQDPVQVQPDLATASVVMTGATVVSSSPSPSSALYEYYKFQLLQIILGILLTLLNTYIQMGINKLIQSVMSSTSNIQKSYTPSIASLGELSMKYANGIIGVNGESFLMNMQLISKFNIGNIQANTLPDGITMSEVNKLMLQGVQALGSNYNNNVCLITLIDPAISITIPGFSQPITVQMNQQMTTVNKCDVIIQGSFIYLIDQINHRSYLFKHANKVVEWFFYKDLKNQFSIEMTDSIVAIGNSRLKIYGQRFDAPIVGNPTPIHVDPRNTQY